MTDCLFVTLRMTATKWPQLTLNGSRNKMNIDVGSALTIQAFVAILQIEAIDVLERRKSGAA